MSFKSSLLCGVISSYIFFHGAFAVSSLSIQTDIGTITGTTQWQYPDVAQFLGVPFAEPPIGNLRWLPPSPKSPIGSFDASQQSPACPQFESSIPSVYNTDAREFLIIPGLTSEDCLTLNIWAPLNATEPLPVLVWIYGGGFQTGGGNIGYQIPTAWVQRSQKHIVVGINYRVNIFGFPNAAGLNQSELNVGLLDQRAGMQWIHDNIAAFGGDTSRISMWGQSAGAFSVDMYNFAYPNNSYLAGHIMDSGSAVSTGPDLDTRRNTMATHKQSWTACARYIKTILKLFSSIGVI
jgi:acetylcholinesterase